MQFKEYLTRAEELKAILNGQQPVTATPAAGASAQKARGPGKSNGDGGGGGGGGGDVCFYALVLPSHAMPVCQQLQQHPVWQEHCSLSCQMLICSLL